MLIGAIKLITLLNSLILLLPDGGVVCERLSLNCLHLKFLFMLQNSAFIMFHTITYLLC